jgi:hypothetical protein
VRESASVAASSSRCGTSRRPPSQAFGYLVPLEDLDAERRISSRISVISTSFAPMDRRWRCASALTERTIALSCCEIGARPSKSWSLLSPSNGASSTDSGMCSATRSSRGTCTRPPFSGRGGSAAWPRSSVALVSVSLSWSDEAATPRGTSSRRIYSNKSGRVRLGADRSLFVEVDLYARTFG